MSSIFLKFFNIIFNISMLFHCMNVAWFMQMLTWCWKESLRLVLMNGLDASTLYVAKPKEGN